MEILLAIIVSFIGAMLGVIIGDWLFDRKKHN
jgi:membrane protein YqaA with SNARE-associated domain